MIRADSLPLYLNLALGICARLLIIESIAIMTV